VEEIVLKLVPIIFVVSFLVFSVSFFSGCAAVKVQTEADRTGMKLGSASIGTDHLGGLNQTTKATRGRVEFKPVEGYATKSEKEKIRLAGEKINEILGSECALSVFQRTKMIDTEGRTNSGVYQHIYSLSGEVPVKMYYRCFGRFPCTSAVAYRVPPYDTINLNRAVFSSRASVCKFASTMSHEGIGHALGEYGHSYKFTKDREFSIPYVLNKVIDQCCK
jgi:hypothetical protein